jgi:hypothetical protein
MADYITALSWEQSEETVAKAGATEVTAADVEPSSSDDLATASSSEDTNDVDTTNEDRAKAEVVEGTIIAEAEVESEECAVCGELILPLSSSNTYAERSETECGGGGHKHQFFPSVRLPQCGHCFHTQCVLKWLVEGKPTCPICRAAVLCPTNTDTTYDTRDLLTPPDTSQVVEEGTHHQSSLSSLFSPTSNESRSRLPVAFRYVSVPRTPLRYVIDHPDMTSPPGSAAHHEELAIALLEMR